MEACIWYLDDILIYGGDAKAEHQAIVEKVVQQCIEHGLAVNVRKSKFHVHETILLVHVINGEEVKMDNSKLEARSKWPIPKKTKEVQVLIALANYYCLLIVNYSAKVCPLMDLTKNCPFT